MHANSTCKTDGSSKQSTKQAPAAPRGGGSRCTPAAAAWGQATGCCWLLHGLKAQDCTRCRECRQAKRRRFRKRLSHLHLRHRQQVAQAQPAAHESMEVTKGLAPNRSNPRCLPNLQRMRAGKHPRAHLPHAGFGADIQPAKLSLHSDELARAPARLACMLCTHQYIPSATCGWWTAAPTARRRQKGSRLRASVQRGSASARA